MDDIDWIDDETMPREETLRRFRNLDPAELVLPEGATLVTGPLTFLGTTTVYPRPGDFRVETHIIEPAPTQ